MRVQHRAKSPLNAKRPPNYRLEPMERRMLLSAALPASWVGYPANYNPNAPIPPGDQGSAIPVGLGPAAVVGAYGAGLVTFGGVTGDGTGQTIAIVGAYDAPTIAADLVTFDTQYNIPAPPSFQKLNDQGLAAPLPRTDPAGRASPDGTWEEEVSMDVEWAHALAPGANIILYEASNADQDLFNTVSRATTNPAVSVISMSFSGDETADEALTMDPIFTTPLGHQGITFLGAAGDSGAFAQGTTTLDPQYPATSPNVIAVGGTRLRVTGGTNWAGETAWGNGDATGTSPDGGGGGGISAYEPQPAYQAFLASGITSTNRTYPDVSLIADPTNGVATVDSYDYGATTPWSASPSGGTSLATPVFAGMIAIADQGRVINGFGTLNGATETLPRLYNLPAADFHDITAGSNGYDTTIGYDLATGRGSPIANLLIPDLASSFIGSHVFSDVNLNGIQDAGEAGIPGVVVTLKTAGTDGIVGTEDDTTVESVTTDSQGFYDFTNVAPGTNYYVNFAPPAGYQISPQVTNATTGQENVADPLTGNTAAFAVTTTTQNYSLNAGVFLQTITITSLGSVIRPSSGVAPMVFTVTIGPVNSSTVDVPFTTVDGTATVANNDYEANSGVLVFTPGVTTETIVVNAIGNLNIENDVSYTVVLTVPTNYAVLAGGTSIGTGLIQNNNFPVVTIAGPPPEVRSATQDLIYLFTVTLSATAPFPVTVNYTTVDNTAVAGLDYTGISGSLIFDPGTTSQIIEVIVLPGTNRQLDKNFSVQLQQASPISETLGDPAQAIGTILTNFSPAIASENGQVTESLNGLAYLPFTVNVIPALTGPVTVDYTTSDGTAIAGVDYQAQAGTLTFNPGRIQQTVYVPVPQQFIAEQTKTLRFTLSNASGDIEIINPVSIGTINYVSLAAVPFSGATRTTRAVNAVYTDALGQRVTVSLKGAGSGDVVFLGSISIDTNAYEILTNGSTNALTDITVKVARNGQTSITDFIASGSVGTINAKTLNIVSTFTVAGSVSTLNLGYIEGTALTIGGINDGPVANLSFNRVLNSTITSAIPIRTLSSGDYINTTGSPVFISAPSVGSVRVRGNFDGTIQTSSLQNLNVTGNINGGVIATSSIGSVIAGSISNSTFFAGIAAGVVGLPTLVSQFPNTAGTIGSIRVRGVFSNSLISAWDVIAVRIGSVATVPGGNTFGLSASHFSTVQTVAGASRKVLHLVDPSITSTVDNFTVFIV